jgi:hypothetical protein
MGSKGSKNQHKQNEPIIQSSQITSTATKQIPVTTTATQAGIITGTSSVPGIATTIPSTLTTMPSGTVTRTAVSGVPTNFNAETTETNFNR